MKPALCLAAATLTAALLPLASVARAIDAGDTMPGVRIRHVDGGVLDRSALTSNVTVINFWATWCGSCKEELREMTAELAGLAALPGVKLAFVSLDKEPEAALKWLRESLAGDLVRKNLYLDPAFEAADLLSVDSFPLTLVVDREGHVRRVQRGFEAGKGLTKGLADFVRTLL